MLDLTDRKHVFYWQTDRNLTPEEYQRIFLKRQEVPDEKLTEILKNGLQTFGQVHTLKVHPVDENVVKGNVNIVRKVTINDQVVVVRMHPQGVKNGYFFAEQVALSQAERFHLPVPKVLEVHEANSATDMDFMVMTAVEGTNMDVYLQAHPDDETKLLHHAGQLLAQIHTIKVDSFGAFDNDFAKHNHQLKGHHATYRDFIWVGLEENLQRLVSFEIVTQTQSQQMLTVFKRQSYEPTNGPRLIHNDYADWNLLTDGKTVTGILDWDECHGGDPIADLACWSTFYDLSRLTTFLEGYTSQTTLPDDYEARFHYYRLRYTISKMALRAKRYQVDKSDFIKDKLIVGKKALAEEVAWFS